MKNRLIFPLFSILLVSLLFSPNVFSENTVVRVAPHAVLGGAHGNPYRVDIVIENGHNVAGYQVMLQFDGNDFKVSNEGDIEIDYGDYLPADAFYGKLQIRDIDPNDDNNTLKVITFAATSLTSESNGDGFLARLTFKQGTTGQEGGLTLLDGTLLANRAGETSVPRFENSKTLPNAVRDLVIESVQAIPTDPNEARHYYGKEEAFKLHATVRNIGNVTTKITNLKLYGPASDVDTTKNIIEESIPDPKPVIEPNGTVEIYLSEINAPTSTGTYYYEVCVTARNENDSNNCSIIKIEVGRPDLKITDIRAESRSVESGKEFSHYGALLQQDPDFATVEPGQQFILYTTLANIGSIKSTETTIGYYFSADDILSKTEKFGTGNQKPVNPNGETIWRWYKRIKAPENPGTYYYGFCVDSVEDEVNTDNNCKVIKVTVEQPGKVTVEQPDLKIIDIRVESDIDTATNKGEFLHYDDLKKEIENPLPATVEPGQQFLLYVTLMNDGPVKSAETTVRYYLSRNNIISETDKKIGTGEQKPLDPNNENSRSLRINAPKNPGIYYYGVCIDSVEDEVNTDNNCKIIKVTVNGSYLEPPPDLISDVAFGPNSTYFIFNPQVPEITVASNSKVTIHEECIITVDIPGVRNEPPGWLDPDPTTIPIDYFMFPLKNVNWAESGDLDPKDVGQEVWDAANNILTETVDFQSTKIKTFTEKVLPKIEQGMAIISVITEIYNIFSNTDNARYALADPKMEIKTGENYYSFLIMIPRRISYVDIKMERYYNLTADEGGWNVLPLVDPDKYTVEYEGRWDLEETFQLENGTPAAPRARPMSLADYPPFQQLPPEVQEYLLQHFEGTTNPGTINTEAWQMPEKTSLLANYPNPFNPETWIPYQLATPADVTLTIYDINGRVVRALDLGHQAAGIYQSRARAAHWDGKNAQGEAVASGIYFYKFTAGDFSATRKMLIRK